MNGSTRSCAPLPPVISRSDDALGGPRSASRSLSHRWRYQLPGDLSSLSRGARGRSLSVGVLAFLRRGHRPVLRSQLAVRLPRSLALAPPFAVPGGVRHPIRVGLRGALCSDRPLGGEAVVRSGEGRGHHGAGELRAHPLGLGWGKQRGRGQLRPPCVVSSATACLASAGLRGCCLFGPPVEPPERRAARSAPCSGPSTPSRRARGPSRPPGR